LWLRADPACLRADINGARLIAHGASLGVCEADAAALLPALKPLFGDAGMALDAPAPDRWYLRLHGGSRLPHFSDPGEALGADLFEHGAEGDQARRWRTLSGEAQILLHNHPWNAQRVASGRLPINALWFWGGGGLPVARAARSTVSLRVFADDPTVRALAGDAIAPLPSRFQEIDGDALYDLAALRDLAALDRDWLQPALQTLHARRIDRLLLDTADGASRVLRRGQRWRLWRRPLQGFAT
ncbi:MAG: phosphoglycerate mutase, partial [Pseudomonadota bacterium]|nr:phosphoglycerate mutase [Pseudomonadota bacterium]